jgi:hypothetical protein
MDVATAADLEPSDLYPLTSFVETNVLLLRNDDGLADICNDQAKTHHVLLSKLVKSERPFGAKSTKELETKGHADHPYVLFQKEIDYLRSFIAEFIPSQRKRAAVKNIRDHRDYVLRGATWVVPESHRVRPKPEHQVSVPGPPIPSAPPVEPPAQVVERHEQKELPPPPPPAQPERKKRSKKKPPPIDSLSHMDRASPQPAPRASRGPAVRGVAKPRRQGCKDDPYVCPRRGQLQVIPAVSDEIGLLLPEGMPSNLIAEYAFSPPAIQADPLPVVRNRFGDYVFSTYYVIDVLRTFSPVNQMLVYLAALGVAGPPETFRLAAMKWQGPVCRFDGNRLYQSKDPLIRGVLNSMDDELDMEIEDLCIYYVFVRGRVCHLSMTGSRFHRDYHYDPGDEELDEHYPDEIWSVFAS